VNYVHPPNRSSYYEQVWAIVRQVPLGRVITYGKITKLVEQPEGISSEEYRLCAPRWVGSAMSACPDDVPWQRVVNAQGKISHRSEPGKQKKLLEQEGVLFSQDKINLDIFQWRGPGVREEIF